MDFARMDSLPSLTVLPVSAVEDTQEPSVNPVSQITAKTVDLLFQELATVSALETMLEILVLLAY